MTMNQWTWLVLGLIAVTSVTTHDARSVHLENVDDDDEEKLTDDYAVEIDGGKHVADLVAATHGLEITRHIRGLGNVYVFSDTLTTGVAKRTSDDIELRLSKDPNVQRIERQKLLRREKRVLGDHDIPLFQYDKREYDPGVGTFESRAFASDIGVPDPDPMIDLSDNKITKDPGIHLRDPRFNKQWYLANTGQTGGPAGKDLNVVEAWKRGITGKGVVVTVLDDGIEHTHPDIKRNYDPKASTDLNSKNDSDPMPNAKVPGNDHGTKCAGEIAAEANNSYCGAGIAFHARIGGVRILDGRVTDSLEAHALLFNNQYVDIYSASWGPRDNGRTMEAPGHYCGAALKKGAEEGRGGKGSIFVWASGNGRMYGDYCSCDGYVSSIYTTSFGSISDLGLSTYFSENCPGNMAVVYTGGSHSALGTAGYRMPPIKVTTTNLGGACTSSFQGTSSAAPLAAGCIALAVQANPKLTYRDVQHLIVETAKIPNAKEMGWTLNGGGKHVHHKFGFGVLDCARLVAKAQKWKTVKPMHKCVVKAETTPMSFGGDQPTIKLKLQVDGCKKQPEHRVDKLEHSQVTVNITHPYRGDVEMFLISPSGTRSRILKPRSRDSSSKGIHFTFNTVHNWGESPVGEWTLIVTDKPPPSSTRVNKGTLVSWGLTLWGTSNEDSGSKSHQLKSKTKSRAYTEHSHPQSVTRVSRELNHEDMRKVISRETSEAKNVKIQELDYRTQKKYIKENMEKKRQKSSPDAAFVDLLKNHKLHHVKKDHGSHSKRGYLKDTSVKQLREFVEGNNNLNSLEIQRRDEEAEMKKRINDLEKKVRLRKLIGTIEELLDHRREAKHKRGYQSHSSSKRNWYDTNP